MAKLITVQKAKEEIQSLQTYIELVEGYNVGTIEKMIIKEYAITNSIAKVMKNLMHQGIIVEKETVVGNN
ncbi:hypothetical protein [Bacillus subtilis]|uniref:Uncharacterized protein n=1 Tax=Bacillus subtilis TaxID=1423 RepID=A0AAP1E2T6_BACIU|nr:hypothetical protein [Bacillus subtilis]KIN51168.1 hypothetical protein B4146_0628 [Bacillus subtilis]KZD87353.1 hypothetical protein B4122_4577 [Bacillus subtilis]